MINKSRKPNRLKDYDYSSNGYYFVTICTHNKAHIFGSVIDGKVQINQFGCIAAEELENIVCHYEMVSVDKYVVMPNHVHEIIVINNEERSRPFPTALPTVIGLYKSGVSKRIHQISPNLNLWQKSFYDHIIRDENEYLRVWKYIDENPLKWETDEYYTNISREGS